MNLIEKICQELGVEVGEIWEGNDGHDYYMNYHGQLCKVIYMDNPEEDEYYKQDKIERVLTGQLKPAWKPKDHEVYYTISFFDEDPAELLEWGDRVWERGLLKRGLVFETKEEAIECANKMLEVIKED